MSGKAKKVLDAIPLNAWITAAGFIVVGGIAWYIYKKIGGEFNKGNWGTFGTAQDVLAGAKGALAYDDPNGLNDGAIDHTPPPPATFMGWLGSLTVGGL